jgi:DNA-binding response OmpR family regulator
MMHALIADDLDTATSIAEALAALGCTSIISTDGTDAIRTALGTPFSLIVLSLDLFDVDRSTVSLRLRSGGVSSALMVTTHRPSTADEVSALETGADDYIAKPFEPIVFSARVMSLLRRQGSFARPGMAIGTFTFDPKRRRCIAADGSTQLLTRRETDVLALLIRSNGAPVSRQRLLDEVWGPDYAGRSNAVDVYIGYLRRKLGASSIVTVRGHGFAAAPRR